jgi:hypothetical protein
MKRISKSYGNSLLSFEELPNKFSRAAVPLHIHANHAQSVNFSTSSPILSIHLKKLKSN